VDIHARRRRHAAAVSCVQYIQYDARSLGMAVLGAPRTFGMTLEARF
jgi:hypothetical protein